ncbi:metal-dependent hydrolase [Lentibacillus sp. CBA3610]|uniref:metal-dependent hydrolase n=1 Tax=Lentibacillus sp. CBA3610 TaxID=2518176 RepID=UPI0015958D02|nr:metal-dependent hydrolase [Lentibacillus sp. CBA3610]QKY70710.1 metal-dependent hydrolase [Lentibacillus sp. CBA3610]
MDGKIHAVIGAGTGVTVAQSIGMEPVETAVLMTTGIIAALVPDLDTAGKLANRISLSHKMIQGFVRTTGIITGAYAWFGLSGYAMYIGLALGVFLLLIAPKFSQKLMLFVSGAAIIAAGVAMMEIWVWLTGVYVAIAALVAHRSYTHSLVGLLFFAIIAFYIQERFAMEGLFWTLVLAYASHLLADMRFVPGNKRGIKLFLPFSQKGI